MDKFVSAKRPASTEVSNQGIINGGYRPTTSGARHWILATGAARHE